MNRTAGALRARSGRGLDLRVPRAHLGKPSVVGSGTADDADPPHEIKERLFGRRARRVHGREVAPSVLPQPSSEVPKFPPEASRAPASPFTTSYVTPETGCGSQVMVYSSRGIIFLTTPG